MTCGECKHCQLNNICNGNHECVKKNIKVSLDDGIRFYGEKNNEACEEFEKVM